MEKSCIQIQPILKNSIRIRQILRIRIRNGQAGSDPQSTFRVRCSKCENSNKKDGSRRIAVI
jgi:hypothetical protein